MSQIQTQPVRPANRTDAIEDRIDRVAAGAIQVTGDKGMRIESMAQCFELAKLMSVSGCAVPPHLRNNPGACLAIAIQGFEWSISPFAIANKSYVVNDRLSYEAAIYNAVVTRRAPIRGRIKCEYSGEGAARKCRVWAQLADEDAIVDYTSPPTGSIKPKNSPLWINDPDQQLFYFSVRAFSRRHFADVMMGIYTVDEMQDSEPTEIVQRDTRTPQAQQLAEKLRDRFAPPIPAADPPPADDVQTIDHKTGEVIAERSGVVGPASNRPEQAPPEQDRAYAEAYASNTAARESSAKAKAATDAATAPQNAPPAAQEAPGAIQGDEAARIILEESYGPDVAPDERKGNLFAVVRMNGGKVDRKTFDRGLSAFAKERHPRHVTTDPVAALTFADWGELDAAIRGKVFDFAEGRIKQ